MNAVVYVKHAKKTKIWKTWSDEDITNLRRLKEQKLTANEIAKILGRTATSISAQLGRLGLTDHTSSQKKRQYARHSEVWSPDEKKKLEALWGEHPMKKILKEIRREWHSIYLQAQYMGLDYRQGKESIKQAAISRGFPPRVFLRIVLKTVGRGKLFRVYPKFYRPKVKQIKQYLIDSFDADRAVEMWMSPSYGETLSDGARRLGLNRVTLWGRLVKAGEQKMNPNGGKKPIYYPEGFLDKFAKKPVRFMKPRKKRHALVHE